jgi:hypothetical protein
MKTKSTKLPTGLTFETASVLFIYVMTYLTKFIDAEFLIA